MRRSGSPCEGLEGLRRALAKHAGADGTAPGLAPTAPAPGLDEEGAAALSPIRARQRKSVLLVDDDPQTREAAVAELLHADVPVRAFDDGNAALAAIAEEKPDVIALEIGLAGDMGGKDLVNMIKATMEWVDIPVILWTRVAVASHREARQIHGADEVVQKSSVAPPRLPPASSPSSAARKPEVEPRLVLASASPRRARILRDLGVGFRVVVSHEDESLVPGEDGPAAVERLARAKALAVASQERLPVLAADTEVLCDGHILGKPSDERDAVAMLRRLAGRAHEVVTGVCVVRGEIARSGVERSVVRLAPMTEEELRWYAATGEPLDKAGGYHIDGKGALFIETVDGSPSNVAGLPVRLLLRLVREAALELGLP